MTGLSCLVCESEMVPHSWPGFLRCPTCSFISADCAYTDQELAELYLEGYFAGYEYLDYVGEEESLRLNFRRRLSVLDLSGHWQTRTCLRSVAPMDFFSTR